MRSGAIGGIVGAGSVATAVAVVLVLQAFAAGPRDASTHASDPSPLPEAFLSGSLPRHLADPPGDATDTGAGGVPTMAGCAAGQAAGQGCASAPVAQPAPAGTPGPHFDIVGVDYLGETRDNVVVSLTVRQLSEGFPELQDPDGVVRMIHYSICWSAAGGACDRTVLLDVMRHAGAVHAEAKFEVRSAACNEWSWCSWAVPVGFAFGAPATMTFTVPKAYAVADGAPLAMHHLSAETGWIEEAAVFPAWHPGATLVTPLYHLHQHGTGLFALNVADATESLALGLTLHPPAHTPYEHVTEGPLLVGGDGANHGASSPYNFRELDILWFDLSEDRGDLVVRFALREMSALPSYDFDYSVAVGVQRHVWEIGYRHEGSDHGMGTYYGYAGRCIMEQCQDGPVMVPVVDVAFGAPAMLTIRVPLHFLGDPASGTPTDLYWAMSMYSDHNLYWGDPAGDLHGDVHSVFEIDSLRGGGQPYVFGSGHRADASFHAGHHA